MDKPQPKIFNTTGVCIPSEHYMLPVLPRIDGVSDMIDGNFYFILHAPRQSGKTTFLKALTDKINLEGLYYALYCSLEVCQDVTDDETAMRRIVVAINESLQQSPIKSLKQLALPDVPLSKLDASVKVSAMLNYLCVNLDKELAVFFDEADCLSGASVLSIFLSQIRLGYNNRYDSEASKFPRSIAFAGRRDIRDGQVQVGPEAESSRNVCPFNIIKESFTLPNFTHEDIKTLYSQHTEASGQIFTDEAVERAWHWTEGQPWLVNALADEVVVKQLKNDYAKVINDSDIDKAFQGLILRNYPHFDYLTERLKEPWVRRVMETVVIGASVFPQGISRDDVKYTVDLGLLKTDPSNSRVLLPANQIYQEIIVRTLTKNIAKLIKDKDLERYPPNRWMDGTNLDLSGLLKAFQGYWVKNSEMFINNNIDESMILDTIDSAIPKYNLISDTAEGLRQEIVNNIEKGLIDLTNGALTHLVIFSFLQRVLNGGADFIKREIALGKLRADICVGYKGRNYPLELKIYGAISLEKSLEQLFGYMNKTLASEGWLVVFDKDFTKPWDKKMYWKTQDYKDKIIHIIGC
jgi:hypothetical protein